LSANEHKWSQGFISPSQLKIGVTRESKAEGEGASTEANFHIAMGEDVAHDQHEPVFENKFTTYRAFITHLANISSKIGTYETRMESLGQNIINDLHEVIKSSTEDNRRLAEETAIITDRAQSHALWLTLFALGVGAILAKGIGQHISRPVEEKQEQMRLIELEQRRSETISLANSFERVVGGVVETVMSAANNLQDAAKALSTSAEESRSRAELIIEASHLASSDVSSVASATEELSYSIREIGEQTQRSHKITSEAAGEAEKTHSCVCKLADGASRIGGIVLMINKIAAQTNMLALNATIEAARAGESGRGFAVVAQEVKALASQTARATQDISKQVEQIQELTKNATELVFSITGTTQEISAIASSIAASVEEQGTATHDIALHIQQASARTEDVNRKITMEIGMSQQYAAAAEQVLYSAACLADQSRTLRSECMRFLEQVRQKKYHPFHINLSGRRHDTQDHRQNCWRCARR
jgi:methyl-accepting chemotaxis protein